MLCSSRKTHPLENFPPLENSPLPLENFPLGQLMQIFSVCLEDKISRKVIREKFSVFCNTFFVMFCNRILSILCNFLGNVVTEFSGFCTTFLLQNIFLD